MRILKTFFSMVVISALTACGGGNSSGQSSTGLPFFNPDVPLVQSDEAIGQLDDRLAQVLVDKNLTGDPTTGMSVKSIDSPLSQLGMKLFYSKSLGGEMDSACVTCHHPMLGGGDNLSLGVGVHAIDSLVLGQGRRHASGLATVPRNAPTTFNAGLYRRSLFWDSRVEQLDGGIRTPESAYGFPDPVAGESLLVAQARFPVTSAEEMRTEGFESGNPNKQVRDHLAARLGAYDGGFNAQSELNENDWLPEFQTAFGSSESAEALVTYDNIALALASYQASQIFIENPWKQYLNGNKSAISDNAKRGAVLFFTAKEQGGGDCFRCHQGDFFTDESHHVVAFPQIGPGKGNGTNADDDFGLERETGDTRDRYKFRTPSLLNVEMTAPYGHTGGYRSLLEVVNHYNEPGRAVGFFNNPNWCRQIAADSELSCAELYPNARRNTEAAQNVQGNQAAEESISNINLNSEEVDQLVEFLKTLTDPCTENRSCLARWIPQANGGPDGNQLNGMNQQGNPL